jgi:hypothetical protein
MKRLKVLIALGMGIMASASGVVQVKAATYNFFVNFDDKEVDNFNDYRQSFSTDTYNLDATVNFYWQGTYRFDSCPTAFVADTAWSVRYRINGTGSFVQLGAVNLPNLPCTTTNINFGLVNVSIAVPGNLVELFIDDDTDFIEWQSRIIIAPNSDLNNRTLYLLGYRVYFDMTYDFNTTYLFNYFLSDQRYFSRSVNFLTATLNATQADRLTYVYTTAGDDEYYIYNSGGDPIGTTRKKYAIDYNEEFFRGESVGAGFTSAMTGTDEFLFPSTPASSSISFNYHYYYLNVSNVAQQLVNAPIFEFVEEDCGSFLALNVGCFINNAFAYITNDAPIVSDAFTLLNAGIEMAAQTFGIIGEFADDNVFGVLILAGFGFIAVKWFLKND